VTELETIRAWWKEGGAGHGRFLALYRVNQARRIGLGSVAEEIEEEGYATGSVAPHRLAEGLKPEFWLHGGIHPTTYKTLRNARRAAGKDGVVLLFDLSLMPVVALEGVVEDEHDGNEFDEYMFAERQVDMWARRAAELKARI
jgi:hypothetical protein